MSAVQDRKETYGVTDINDKAFCDPWSETVVYRTSSDKWRYKNKHMIISLKSEEKEIELTSWSS
jgi:hypothetical protein